MASLTADPPILDYGELKARLLECQTDADLLNTIVNLPFNYKIEAAELFLGIISLVLVNKKTGTIDRVALSDTEFARNIGDVSVISFKDIKISPDSKDNITAKALRTQLPQDTTDWNDLLVPLVSAEQARINQAVGGISYSLVYPFKARGGGALTYSYFQYTQAVNQAQQDFMKEYTELVASVLDQFSR